MCRKGRFFSTTLSCDFRPLTIIISPVSEGSGDVMVLRQSRPSPAARCGVNAITQKTTGWIVLKFGIHIGSDSVLTWLTFQGRRSKVKVTASENDFWIFISYHIFLLNQVEGAIAIPPSNSAPLPLFCPSVCPSVCQSIGLLTTFSGFCTFADKSLGRNGIELEMQMFPDDLPLANIDADGYCCHFMRSSVRPTIHGLGFVYCIQSAWKKWPTIWHADVSRWLTLSIHGCLWILLLVCLSVHLSVCGIFRWLCICWQITWNKWHKIWHDDVVIIGRWLLPSLVDTGDICCHYWQLILVSDDLRVISNVFGTLSQETNILEEIEQIMGTHAERSSPSWVCIPQKSWVIARDFWNTNLWGWILFCTGAHDGFSASSLEKNFNSLHPSIVEKQYKIHNKDIFLLCETSSGGAELRSDMYWK